jgi:hypothetical protein
MPPVPVRIFSSYPAMNETGQIGSEQLRRLDIFVSKPHDDCIEAIEWIPLLSANDWRLLETIWNERPVDWRANCAVIVGDFPLPPSQAILRLALADASDDVAVEAAIAMCGLMLRHPQLVPFDRSLVPRLQELKRGERGRFLFEVDEILRLHGEAG